MNKDTCVFLSLEMNSIVTSTNGISESRLIKACPYSKSGGLNEVIAEHNMTYLLLHSSNSLFILNNSSYIHIFLLLFLLGGLKELEAIMYNLYFNGTYQSQTKKIQCQLQQQQQMVVVQTHKANDMD